MEVNKRRRVSLFFVFFGRRERSVFKEVESTEHRAVWLQNLETGNQDSPIKIIKIFFKNDGKSFS